jgi:hypothetical protein
MSGLLLTRLHVAPSGLPSIAHRQPSTSMINRSVVL